MRAHAATLEEENRRLRIESQARDGRITQLERMLQQRAADVGAIIESVAFIQNAQMPANALPAEAGVFNSICGWLGWIWDGICNPFMCLFEAVYTWLKNSQVNVVQ